MLSNKRLKEKPGSDFVPGLLLLWYWHYTHILQTNVKPVFEPQVPELSLGMTAVYLSHTQDICGKKTIWIQYIQEISCGWYLSWTYCKQLTWTWQFQNHYLGYTSCSVPSNRKGNLQAIQILLNTALSAISLQFIVALEAT